MFVEREDMIRWTQPVAVGFLRFVGVTAAVATAGLDAQTRRSLVYLVVAGYGLGLVGMAVAMVQAGGLGRVILGLFVGLGTGAIAGVAILSRYSFSVALPF